ncbi:DNA-binding protein [Moorena producens PAL-8-15-08-1]|uniref:DNA-binding protein n=1 Tax=Moorena producens PAL-8-15-08-1 TaxID=1458985 RepID=A0A1D8TN51_9CYAN|nr:type II toxin-antitoxin system VapC family toxin [Moorena producens]AOW99002.1 DNA-binding protein [Moorena producens PAL-8-15-08-1]
MLLVIDSSVVAKWLFVEPLTKQALAVRNDWELSRVDLIAPELMLAEVGNIIWKRQRVGLITEPEGNSLIAHLLALSVPTVETETILPRAYSLGAAFERTVYDALYLALAEAMAAKFITADLPLYNAVSGNLPFIDYLGNY